MQLFENVCVCVCVSLAVLLGHMKIVLMRDYCSQLTPVVRPLLHTLTLPEIRKSGRE